MAAVTTGHLKSVSESPRQIIIMSRLSNESRYSVASNFPRWPRSRAWQWAEKHGWKQGCNFVPSSASNQLEMWQAETFDPDTIRRELGYASKLKYNAIRVFLHDLLYQKEGTKFLDRVDAFLDIADSAGFQTMLVLFDGVWDPHPKLGPQSPPRPHVHNSRWIQSPGANVLVNEEATNKLKPYVEAVVSRFGRDDRVILFGQYWLV
jgi:hypothetical protein